MAVQAPVFFDHLGFPVTGSSQDYHWITPNPGFGLPDPFHNYPLLNTVTPSPPAAPNLYPLRFPNTLADEFDKQTRDIDAFLQLQSERLRSAIHQQNKKQISALVSSVEAKSIATMKKAEQELARVTRRARELEECLKRAEAETEAWKRIAGENEAMVVGLNNMLGQVRERLSWAYDGLGPAQDAESVCNCDWAGEGRSARGMGCGGCKTRRSCVVFLPCKHLCACRECGSLLGVCPVCESVKEGAVEVFFE